MHLPILQTAFVYLNKIVLVLEKAATDGGSFMFGYLGGGPLPYKEIVKNSSYIIAFRVMPIIIFMSAVSSLLYHFGLVQWLVKKFSAFLQKTMGISGLKGLSVAASVFLGIVETPLFLKPYVSKMSRCTMFTMMTAAMATVAGTVMVLYASVIKAAVPGAITHILVASIISAPAAIVIAHIWVPETTEGEDNAADHKIVIETQSAMDALLKGANDGISLAISVVGIIIVLFSFVSLTNQLLALIPVNQGKPWTLEALAALPFKPVVWLMGVPWAESETAARLMGVKTILNEFVSYQQLSTLAANELSDKSRIILTYSMCGFANLASLALLTGSLTVMAPERQNEIAELALKSLVSGTLATCMTGAVIAIII
jgi:CNT family concentrative nucleoside transporter